MSSNSRVTINPELIHQIAPCVYEIPTDFIQGMRVPGYVYLSPDQFTYFMTELQNWISDRSRSLPALIQVATVATLPGISKGSFAMPDVHAGYGFSIGGVAAIDLSDPEAIISPGGVGYDINCGIRCIVTHLPASVVIPRKSELIAAINSRVASGVGGGNKGFITSDDLEAILSTGLNWALSKGYATAEDIENCEEHGCLTDADPSFISARAKARGLGQMGSIGSGNHFIEIQEVSEIFDAQIAEAMGLVQGEVVVMVHTGSRGLGYEVASNYSQMLELDKNVLNRQLGCTQFTSETGQQYWKAMCASANYAFCNRQVITYFIRQVFQEMFAEALAQSPNGGKMELIYDVCHNIAKIEEFDGKRYLIHRKGATRAFGRGRLEVPEKYRNLGQPVLIGGSLATASYILVGTDEGMNIAFGSTCHGSGRTLSRSGANKTLNEDDVKRELQEKGVEVRAASKKTIVEEAPQTYKDVDSVVDTCQVVGLSKKVAKTIPLAVIKG